MLNRYTAKSGIRGSNPLVSATYPSADVRKITVIPALYTGCDVVCVRSCPRRVLG